MCTQIWTPAEQVLTRLLDWHDIQAGLLFRTPAGLVVQSHLHRIRFLDTGRQRLAAAEHQRKGCAALAAL